jgi:hypothetical protein
MALLQMKLTTLDIPGFTAVLTPQPNVIQENELRGVTSLTITATTVMLSNKTNWRLNAFYDVKISKSYE